MNIKQSNEQTNEQYQQRFGGIARLYGMAALTKFSQSHICIIGVGGVGSWAAESLVRSGIGEITLIDMDDICITNTNRQIHTLKDTIGKLKTAEMKQRILGINPSCKVNVIDDFINQTNLADYLGDKLTPKFDFIIDAIDSINDKTSVLAYCRRNKLKVITIGGAAGKIDPTKIEVKDLAKSVQDPLLSKLRENLKSKYKLSKDSKGKYGILCVFSCEQIIYPKNEGQVCHSKKEALFNKKLNCESGLGSITQVTATFGFVAVSHILKKLSS